MDDSGLPVPSRGYFSGFRRVHVSVVCGSRACKHSCNGVRVRSDFLRGKTTGRRWNWRHGRLALGCFPKCVSASHREVRRDASIAALLVATIVWATLELPGSQRTIAWIGYGLLWGLTLMTSATLASLLPLLLGWLAYRRHKQGSPWLAKPLLAAAVAVLCCVPWTARNYEVFHAFVPLRSILGLQLWVGNNPDAQDRWPAHTTRFTMPTSAPNMSTWAKSPTCRGKKTTPSITW